MASSSAPNIFSGSMSFSRETCRMTDGSMIMATRSLIALSVSPRPLEVEPGEPNIAETDIIDFAFRLINDGELVSFDAIEAAREVARGRDRRRLRSRLLDDARHHGLVR